MSCGPWGEKPALVWKPGSIINALSRLGSTLQALSLPTLWEHELISRVPCGQVMRKDPGLADQASLPYSALSLGKVTEVTGGWPPMEPWQAGVRTTLFQVPQFIVFVEIFRLCSTPTG